MYAIVEMVELSFVVRAIKNKAVAVENRRREMCRHILSFE
jgi:hypothetical protein